MKQPKQQILKIEMLEPDYYNLVLLDEKGNRLIFENEYTLIGIMDAVKNFKYSFDKIIITREFTYERVLIWQTEEIDWSTCLIAAEVIKAVATYIEEMKKGI